MNDHTRAVRAGITIAPLLLTSILAGCERSGASGGHDGHDHGPPGASSDEVSLTADQVKAAAVKTAVVGPGTVTERLRLTAVVQESLDAQAHLTPNVPGLVRSWRRCAHSRLGRS